MGTFRVTTDINRPATDVFAFIADPRNMPRWYEAVDRVAEVTPKTATQAATYRITRSLPGGRADNIVEVAESTPDLMVTVESRVGPTPFHYHYRIESIGNGSRLTLDADISSAGLPGPLAYLDGVATRAFKHGMQRNLEELRRLVESDAP